MAATDLVEHAARRALDALSAHLDDVRPLLKAHTFKKLQGNPAPPATHELYLWSDGSAWRLFGHYDDEGCFVADSIVPDPPQ